MRILFLSKYDVKQGGVAEVVAQLAANLMREGIEVLTISSHPSAMSGLLANGLKCRYSELPAPGFSRYFRNRPAISKLLAFSRENRIDLVHAHGAYRPAYAALILKQKLGIPYVVTSHGDLNPSCNPRLHKASGRRRYREILKNAEKITHLSARLRDHANSLINVNEKSHLIPNGVDNAWWNMQPEAGSGRYMLALGRLSREKGFDRIIRAYRKALDYGVRLPLVIAGDGKERDFLERLAIDLGLRVHQTCTSEPGVLFPGYICDDTKRQFFADASLFLFPSQEEAFPLVLLEAMAAGKPIVASDIPAVRELIVAGQNGEIVDQEDVDSWAAAMVRLGNDPEGRNRYGEANRRAVKKYDWPEICRRYIDVYSSCKSAEFNRFAGPLRPEIESLA